jgi:hypothetical protein
MKIEYSILALALALVYGILINFLPDFPIDPETLLAFIVYVLVKLGVEVVGAPARRFLARFK